MTSKAELQEWINTLDDTAMIGVDDGGLVLVVDESDACFEIGGMPVEDEE